MAEILYESESYKIVGACFEVYNRMGPGFLEAVYQECLEMEFAHQGIPFVSQPELQLEYRGRPLNQKYRPDFVCYGKIVVEIKAASVLVDGNRAQLYNCLKASRFKLGLLVNFGSHQELERERIVFTHQ